MPSIPERHKTAARSAIIKVPGLSAMTATAKRAGGRTVCLCIARLPGTGRKARFCRAWRGHAF